jgi:CDP-4-dehydro-6-deoxyglucose reductase
MSFQITVQSSSNSNLTKTFDCQAGETLLDAALRAQIVLPYGCKNGACGSCKGKVLQGSFDMKPHDHSILTQAEHEQHTTLLCSVRPQSDLVVEARLLEGGITVQKMPGRVHSLVRLNDDVMKLLIQLPNQNTFEFKAGQYIDFILKSGDRRSYSMATAPSEKTGLVEFHIRWMQGGVFTEHVFEHMKEREILRMEGPLGTFYLRDTKAPIIMLASGTGFAPIYSILKEIVAQNGKNVTDRSIHFYWGARRRADLYASTQIEALTAQLTQLNVAFKYIPVLSEPSPECQWTGRTGLVHHAVLADFAHLNGYEIYACGAPIMVNAAHTDFVNQKQMNEDDFFSDAFISKADLIKNT